MASKRELINTGTDKRYVRRNDKLSADRRVKAKRKVKSGHGDEGDR